MVTITCPWCEDDGLVAFSALEEAEVAFTCAECGTTVSFVEEPAESFDRAA
jgi:hypothetical protein